MASGSVEPTLRPVSSTSWKRARKETKLVGSSERNFVFFVIFCSRLCRARSTHSIAEVIDLRKRFLPHRGSLTCDNRRCHGCKTTDYPARLRDDRKFNRGWRGYHEQKQTKASGSVEPTLAPRCRLRAGSRPGSSTSWKRARKETKIIGSLERNFVFFVIFCSESVGGR